MDRVLMRPVISPVSGIVSWADMARVARIVGAVDSTMGGVSRGSRDYMMAGICRKRARGTAVN